VLLALSYGHAARGRRRPAKARPDAVAAG